MILRIWDPPPLEHARLQTFDLLQKIQPRDVSNLPLIIVDIDDVSLETVGQWPWPRTKLAELVDRITDAGAVVIAFDMIFAEPDQMSPNRIASSIPGLDANLRRRLELLPSNDTLFADAISESRVVLGQSGTVDAPQGERTSPVSSIAFLGGDPKPHLIQFPELLRNIDELEQAAAGRGLFSVRAEIDGVVRRLPTVVTVEGSVMPSLSIELLRLATGEQTIVVKTSDTGVEAVSIGETIVPTDKSGQIWVHFSKHHPARYISAQSILNGDADPTSLANKLVLIGTSAVGLFDIRVTPIDPAMPGVEVHAQMLETILTGSQLVRPDYAFGAEVVLAIAMGVLAIVLVPRFGVIPNLIVGAMFAGVAVALIWLLYSQKNMLFDMVYPLMSMFAVWLALTLRNYAREAAEKRWVRGAFDRYLAPDVVERLARDPKRLTLGGETRTLSILFTDVRGFTGISESYANDPQGLTTLMNRFLTPLSNAIVERSGTIDKYMGDAIMAFWNAPLDVSDHAGAACNAALDMLDRLMELNAREDANATIRIGIGINTGACVVGNMGSDSRFDYSALGDSVNLASRIEGLTKHYQLNAMIGSETAQHVQERFAVLEIDRLRVKGKTEPETVYALLGGEVLAAADSFKKLKNEMALVHAAYRAQNWDGALAGIASVRENDFDAGIAGFLDMFEQRIRALNDTPPGESWDGVSQF